MASLLEVVRDYGTTVPHSPYQLLHTCTSCSIREVARLDRTLVQWCSAFLGYFHTGGAGNGGTEAMKSLIELHRRIGRGFRNRDNYRFLGLLIGGGLNL